MRVSTPEETRGEGDTHSPLQSMRDQPRRRDAALAITLVLAVLSIWIPSAHMYSFISQHERAHLRDEAREMFYHSFDKYMEHAYPLDELMPLSCKGKIPPCMYI